jgi:predicted nucleic acid-binding protein
LTRTGRVALGGDDVIVPASTNYLRLRARSVPVRGTIDVVLATRCIVSGHRLLHSNRALDTFEKHLGLRRLSSNA